mmetsp:Transcript_1053/g.2336  ORF Transcript_1053/g.2336 Transcript_1053/m.2336 type:complete len:721 (-) Transcript_1053:276-2438(-)|eukprot:CAMPEP_0201125980 /NCGR_PEP_ID=MMETSP0850-20130426/24133_1 /ASSEMBLY_ACC=CAM_ASM_000622 /TAXON_ID=183588 /ORGANISM="Pseudo-nitzschia fraudulenta, Strain WWA7" /LENGTH=720 /DNA_ID=CAMNT_0047394219 /DNA_START=142 /DNA_END=2304 /DNA_ORIENTATION=+
MYPSRSPKKHRVLIYVTCYNVLDGVTLTLRKIEQEILAQGHHVCIISTNSGNSQNTHMHMEEEQYQRYRHLPNRHPNRKVIFLDNAIPIPFLHDPNNPEDSYHLGFSLSVDVRKKLDDYGPTIVHVTVPDVTCLHLIQYARERQLPLMGTYHSNIPDYFTHYPGIGWLKHIIAGYERHNYNFLQALFVPTPFIRRHLTVEEHYRFDKITDLKVWGRGVDLKRFHPAHRSEDFRARYGFTPDDVVVTWVGRLVPEKRPDIFANVVRRLTEEGHSFKALVVGAGPCEGEIKSLPNTTFAGWVTGEELAVAYASSDIFLFPSAVETFGNVTLEAAASGLPLVVDAGCSGHLVQHGLSGFACNESENDSYYNGTLSLILDSSRRKAMSKEGRQLSLRFEKRTVCRRMIENYSKITEDFYGRYGGNHSNRDREYENKPESFLGGSYVRPTSLMLVEYIFIFIFRIAYRLGECLYNTKQFFASTQLKATRVGPETTDESMRLVSYEPPNALVAETTEFTGVSVSVIGDQATSALHLDSEMEEPTFGEDTDSIDEITLSCDDASSGSCSSSFYSTKTPRYKDRFWRSELPFSHNLAILFIKSVRAQGRIECRIRKRCARTMVASPSSNFSVLSTRRTNRAQQRKRKCSEELTPDDLNGTGMLAMQLKESLLPARSCCSSDSSRSSDYSSAEDIDMVAITSTNTFTGRTCNEQGLNSRKVKSSSNLQV